MKTRKISDIETGNSTHALTTDGNRVLKDILSQRVDLSAGWTCILSFNLDEARQGLLLLTRVGNTGDYPNLSVISFTARPGIVNMSLTKINNDPILLPETPKYHIENNVLRVWVYMHRHLLGRGSVIQIAGKNSLIAEKTTPPEDAISF